MCDPSISEEDEPPSPEPPKRRRTSTHSHPPFQQASPPIHNQTSNKTILNIDYLTNLQRDAHHQSLNPPTPPIDRHHFDAPSPYDSWSVEQSHPSFVASKRLESEQVCRQFPLRDFNEACLFRYYIDEVSPWVGGLHSLLIIVCAFLA